jgi:hypothetical protein
VAGSAFHYLIPLVLCTVGFHGVFYYSNLWKKTAAWCVFQLGLIVFLLQLAPIGGSFSLALVLLVAFSTLAVGATLGMFCLKLARRHKTTDGDEITRRVSK